MSYFNHAYKKSFVATKATQTASTPGQPNGRAAVTAGILLTKGIHVSKLVSTSAAEGYQLGIGVVGLFDSKSNESVLGADIAANTAPFYLASTALKLNDKIGPFHGGYQTSNKSKMINPKFMRKVWTVNSNPASQAVVEIGVTEASAGVATIDTIVAGSGYTAGTDVATTGGTGTGLTVDITVNTDALDTVVINTAGSGYTVGDVITVAGGTGGTFTVVTVTTNRCIKEFLCGETYYLRVEVKGTPALRFANHNLNQTLQADGGCCADPSMPSAVDASIIYAQWGQRLVENNYLKSFIRPLLVVDGQSYAYTVADAIAEGLDPATKLVSMAPTVSITAGLVLKGAYVDTNFANATFQTSDYYGIEPIQIIVSEVDLGGDPCVFGGVCIEEKCPGIQANGTGEQKIRDIILSESYLQNFMSSDFRIREITQGTQIFDIIDRTALYSSVYILHSVPRYNNPSGTFDNDQYLLEVIGTSATVTALKDQLNTVIAAGNTGTIEIEDLSAAGTCSYTIPVV